MQQEVVLAMLAKEPSHGYELRARLREALGPLGDAMNDGQVYVTLARLEKAGLATSEQSAGRRDRPDRKVYALTAAGQQRVAGWLAEDVDVARVNRRLREMIASDSLEKAVKNIRPGRGRWVGPWQD